MRFCRHSKPINANFNGMRMVDPTFPMQQQWCRFSWRKNWDKIDFTSTTVTDQNLIPWRHRWLLLAGDDIWCKRITAPLNLAAVRPHQGPAAQTWAVKWTFAWTGSQTDVLVAIHLSSFLPENVAVVFHYSDLKIPFWIIGYMRLGRKGYSGFWENVLSAWQLNCFCVFVTERRRDTSHDVTSGEEL